MITDALLTMDHAEIQEALKEIYPLLSRTRLLPKNQTEINSEDKPSTPNSPSTEGQPSTVVNVDTKLRFSEAPLVLGEKNRLGAESLKSPSCPACLNVHDHEKPCFLIAQNNSEPEIYLEKITALTKMWEARDSPIQLNVSMARKGTIWNLFAIRLKAMAKNSHLATELELNLVTFAKDKLRQDFLTKTICCRRLCQPRILDLP